MLLRHVTPPLFPSATVCPAALSLFSCVLRSSFLIVPVSHVVRNGSVRYRSRETVNRVFLAPGLMKIYIRGVFLKIDNLYYRKCYYINLSPDIAADPIEATPNTEPRVLESNSVNVSSRIRSATDGDANPVHAWAKANATESRIRPQRAVWIQVQLWNGRKNPHEANGVVKADSCIATRWSRKP